MKFTHFMVDRPIFASVLWILALLVGYIAYVNLPVAQYPDIAPPTIVVRATYPGANAETIAATVATPIEQELAQLPDGRAPLVAGRQLRPALPLELRPHPRARRAPAPGGRRRHHRVRRPRILAQRLARPQPDVVARP